MPLPSRLLAHQAPPAFLLPCIHLVQGTAGSSTPAPSRRRYARIARPDIEDASTSARAEVDTRSKAFSPNRSARGEASTGEDPSEWSFPTKPNPSPFEVMHLPTTAEPSEIKKQYYKLALLYHPDSSHPSSSSDHFHTLQKAYQLLTTPSARSLYLRTGMGWSPLGPDVAPSASSWADEEMRRQARYRGHPGARYGRAGGLGRGEAGYERMRWGYEADLGRGMGEPTEMGSGEGRYMSHPRFFGSLTILAILFGLVQYNRALHATDMAREVVERRHVGASQALAEARHEAKLYGRERREQIRRIVRSMEVERDYGARMARANAGGHGLEDDMPRVSETGS